MSVSQSEKIDQLAAALVKAQAAMVGAVKSADNPFYKSKYADLSAVWAACREALNSNGLSVAQFPSLQDSVPPIVQVTTVLLHESGQWMSGTAGAPLSKLDAQGVGSCVSYLRRILERERTKEKPKSFRLKHQHKPRKRK